MPGMDDPLSAYMSLVDGSGMVAAQSLADALLILQPYAIALAFILAALFVTLMTLTHAPFAEVYAARMRQELWEFMWERTDDD